MHAVFPVETEGISGAGTGHPGARLDGDFLPFCSCCDRCLDVCSRLEWEE